MSVDSPPTSLQLPEMDRNVLDLIRYEGSLSVSQLCDLLEVTATAIRQRLSRLKAAELIEEEKIRQQRGRPLLRYRLTTRGLRAMGENLSDLAEALWLEVNRIADPQIRQTVIDGVLQRLTERYREQVSGDTVTERLRSIAILFRQRKIPFVVENEGRQAVLKIVGCPYPKLNDHSNEICQFEQRLVARLLDAPVALDHCSCQSSGGQCCTFTAQVTQQLNQLSTEKPPAVPVPAEQE